jgi:hypothetical protein
MIAPVQGVRCFLLTPSDRYRVSLHRDAPGDGPCPGGHRAQADACDRKRRVQPVSNSPAELAKFRAGDPRWPATCAACGRPFGSAEGRAVFFRRIYDRGDGGPPCTLSEAPPGAVWDASWMPDSMKGPDGRSVVVRLPNGRDWYVDSRANNCTRPADTTHRCWVRHGTPPDLTVDKSGDTCSAGGGSIQSGDYHGFLRQGFLVP